MWPGGLQEELRHRERLRFGRLEIGGIFTRGGDLDGEDLIDGEVLRREDAVQAFEREGTFLIEKVGDVSFGQPGRLTQLEERVEQHERSVQRMKGLVGAVGGVLTALHVAIDYFRR